MRPLPHRLRGHLAPGDLAAVDGVRKFVVNDAECVGCNLCVLVCPVENCITLVHKTEGVDPRTGQPYDRPPRDWTTHPNNPAVQARRRSKDTPAAPFRRLRPAAFRRDKKNRVSRRSLASLEVASSIACRRWCQSSPSSTIKACARFARASRQRPEISAAAAARSSILANRKPGPLKPGGTEIEIRAKRATIVDL